MEQWKTIATCKSHWELHALMNAERRKRHKSGGARPYRRWPDYKTTRGDDGIDYRTRVGWAVQQLK